VVINSVESVPIVEKHYLVSPPIYQKSAKDTIELFEERVLPFSVELKEPRRRVITGSRVGIAFTGEHEGDLMVTDDGLAVGE
jgi:hypothetical protein